MHRAIVASLAVLVLGLAPLKGASATVLPAPGAAAGNPAIYFVDGWWEQEHRSDASDRYSKWSPAKRKQYDRIQAAQNKRDAERRRIEDQNNRAVQDQHRLLGY